MENKKISTHTELALQIMHLKAQKFDQEQELNHAFKEFAYTLNPLTIVKNSIHELATYKEVKSDLATIGMNIGANFIIDQVLGRNRSVKGFIGSVLVEQLSSVFINNGSASKVISGLSSLIPKLFERKNGQHEHHQNGNGSHHYN